MTEKDLNILAKKFIAGEWLYSTSEKILKKNFADNKQLLELDLIDADGYLNDAFKAAIEMALGEEVLANTVGPFGDKDFFSGDIFDDFTQYNLELHQISEATMDALQKLPGVTIKITD